MSLFLHVAGLNKVKETDSQKEVLNIKLITLYSSQPRFLTVSHAQYALIYILYLWLSLYLKLLGLSLGFIFSI